MSTVDLMMTDANAHANLMHSSGTWPRPAQPVLSMDTFLERQTFTYNSVHNFWALVSLKSQSALLGTGLSVDFVVIIDISASMNLECKLAYVKATIQYLLIKLTENHRFTLIVFNHNVQTLVELATMTNENKQRILEILTALEASGSTNMAEALLRGIDILQRRPAHEQSRLSTIMLFTDGLSNRGGATKSTFEVLQETGLPHGCVINTFGYGEDHDSRLLNSIAMRAQGTYYYVQTPEAIAATFGECLAGVLSTHAHSIKVFLRAQDGARVVALATPYPINELKAAKDYDVQQGSLFQGESKSLLCRISLRSMPQPLSRHELMKVGVQYVNALTNQVEQIETSLAITRTVVPLQENIPTILDQHINRYFAATTINEAIELAKQENYNEAQLKLYKLIERIQQSVSANEPYCLDLVKDIRECLCGMRDFKSFATGMHYAQAYSEMYFLERSTGSRHLFKIQDAERHNGYGYTTVAQEIEAANAVTHTKNYVFAFAQRS
jgi:hypothetical protein